MGGLVKNIMILGGLALVGAVGYYLYVTQQSSELVESVSGSASVQDPAAQTQLFLRQLDLLAQIELSYDIFVDPRFQSFTDETPEPNSFEVGRENPFLPSGI